MKFTCSGTHNNNKFNGNVIWSFVLSKWYCDLSIKFKQGKCIKKIHTVLKITLFWLCHLSVFKTLVSYCPALPCLYLTPPPLPPILSSFCCLPLTICLCVSSHPPAVRSCSLCIHASRLAQSSWASDLIKTFKEQLQTFTDLRAAPVKHTAVLRVVRRHWNCLFKWVQALLHCLHPRVLNVIYN